MSKKTVPVSGIPEGDSCLITETEECPLFSYGDEDHCYCLGWDGKQITDNYIKHDKCKAL